jgi:hypothetical protein
LAPIIELECLQESSTQPLILCASIKLKPSNMSEVVPKHIFDEVKVTYQSKLIIKLESKKDL